MKSSKKMLVILVGLALAAAAVGAAMLSGKSSGHTLASLMKEVEVREAQPVRSSVDPTETPDLAAELPALEESSWVVKGSGEVDLTIFCSPEKAGEGKDGWMKELAQTFNRASFLTASGKTVSVSLADVTSGLASDYIISGKEVPDLFSPSSALWGQMTEAEGVHLETLLPVTVENTAGILIKNSVWNELKDKEVTLETILGETISGSLVTGYTNPYTSSTGLNFLVSALASQDQDNLLSDKAVSGFSQFQKNIPYVGTNTQQLLKAAANGTFDALMLESQQYENSPELKRDYHFVPFGYPHNNPLYAVGNLSAEKQEAADKFVETLTTDKARELAQEDGFGTAAAPEAGPVPDGNTLRAAQTLWKREKDANRTIAAVFVADVSGSMEGEPLTSLQNSLINAMQYISPENYVSLYSYNQNVTRHLPLTKFDLNARSLYKGAVESMIPGGRTASYSALAAAMQEIADFQAANPDLDVKPMIFLLSDGETNEGISQESVSEVLRQLGYPVYTIGYNTYLEPLEQLSEINEAVLIDANNDDIVYKLKQLFNANL